MTNIVYLEGFKNTHQQSSQWCWAACVQMVLNFYEPNKHFEQCDIVAIRYGQKDCKAVYDTKKNKAISEFNFAAVPDDIAIVIENLDSAYNFSRVDDNLKKWETIKSEIDNNHLLIANLGNHYVVIFGYVEDELGAFFLCYNPEPTSKDNFIINKFKECDKYLIEGELLLISPKQTNRVIIPNKKGFFIKKINHLKDYFKETPFNKITALGVKPMSSLEEIDLVFQSAELPPQRFDAIINNEITATYTLCGEHWVKTKLKTGTVYDASFEQVEVNGKMIKLDNKAYKPLKNSRIKPMKKTVAQYEKIIFQPSNFRFYRIRQTEDVREDLLIAVKNYEIKKGDILKKGKAYPIMEVINKIKTIPLT